MNPDSGLNPLAKRFPIRKSMPASIFWDLYHMYPYRPCTEGLAWRARVDEAVHQEVFAPVTEPIPLPALAALPDETQRFGGEFAHHEERDIFADSGYLYRPATERGLDRDLRRTERRHVLARVRRAIGRGQ